MNFMTHIFCFLGCAFLLMGNMGCDPKVDAKPTKSITIPETPAQTIIYISGNTISTRFNAPIGFARTHVSQNSFGEYLRNLPLKPDGSKVKYFDGDYKENNGVYVAVVDLSIGNKDLHQCADAVMRLRADYLYSQKRYDEIHFNFTNGFTVEYSEYMKGKRMVVSGNKTYWKQYASPSNTEKDFTKYKELIFMYAGTLSLSRELKSVSVKEMKIGDVFIQGGSPGHAVIVVDIAMNSETSEKLFMLAQSYMPAQEIQILANPINDKVSPWYSTSQLGYLQTPEWSFESSELMRFEE